MDIRIVSIIFKIKVVKIGNSLRITLPIEIVEATKLNAGDTVGITLDNSTINVKKISSLKKS